METTPVTTNNSNHELLRDVYASQLLVHLATQAGFLAEPAVINLATDEEYYTLSVIHMWLIETGKIYVHISHQADQPEDKRWSCDLYSTHPDDEEQYYCKGLLNQPNELGHHKTYPEALEAGLKHAFRLLI